MTAAAWRRSAQIATGVAATALATWLFLRLGAYGNSASIGFGYFLVVIAAARLFGALEAGVATAAAALQFDYWFLPPTHTFTIADPRNWLGLFMFLVAAAVVTGLSVAARRRTREAEARRQEVARLYALSRASLLAEPSETIAQIERALVAIFGFADVWLEVPERPLPDRAAYNMHWPLRVGQRHQGALHVQSAAVADDVGETIAGIVAIALERIRVLRESGRFEVLRESEALKSSLLDSVTHDMRTPLTSMKAAVTTLLSGDGEPARQELLAVIDEECDFLNDMVESLVDMARIESGNLRPVLARQSLVEVIDATLERARLPAERVRLSLPAALPPVRVDARLLSQALGKLLQNAAAYGGAGAPIEVSVRDAGPTLVTEVADRGPGIAAAELPHIFEKFYRDPQARRLRPEGLGMGLAIARGIIEAHHGELHADSTPGRGTRVWFSLPKAADA